MIPIKISPKHRETYNDQGILKPWAWANETFGPPRSIIEPFDAQWYFDAQLTFYFRKEKDAVLFALKWA